MIDMPDGARRSHDYDTVEGGMRDSHVGSPMSTVSGMGSLPTKSTPRPSSRGHVRSISQQVITMPFCGFFGIVGFFCSSVVAYAGDAVTAGSSSEGEMCCHVWRVYGMPRWMAGWLCVAFSQACNTTRRWHMHAIF